MSPFQYSAPTAPYTSKIIDILEHLNDPRVHAAETGAQAQARADEIRGQIWGGVAQQAGQIPAQMQQAKRQQQQTDLGALQLGEQKKAIAARDAFLKIIKDTPQMDEDGVSLYDVPAVAKQLQAIGMDPGDAVKHLGGINDAFRAEKAAKLALVKRGAEGIIAVGTIPS